MLDCVFAIGAFYLFKEDLRPRRLGAFVGPQNLGRFVMASSCLSRNAFVLCALCVFSRSNTRISSGVWTTYADAACILQDSRMYPIFSCEKLSESCYSASQLAGNRGQLVPAE